jgi:hypothetical protein
MSRDREDLHPLFRPVFDAVLEESRKRLGDSTLRVAETFRSPADQAAAKAAGKSRVTIGWHQFGLAFDVAIISPEGAYVTDGNDPRYALVGQVAVEHGCVWGGNWISFKDAAHVEWHPGFTLGQYMAWLDTHRVVTA